MNGMDTTQGAVQEKNARRGSAYGMEFIRRILLTVGVDRWEDLPGKHVRVRARQDRVLAIGHITEDRWFTPADLAEQFP